MAKARVLVGLLAATIARASPFDSDAVNLHPRAACSGNTATTRSEWCDYDISTDYYNDGPTTGVTREYWWEITEFTAAPDGVERSVMAINGSIPGPTLFADWGDTVVVHVTNSVPGNGTSIHFHGIRQNYTNPNDGVSSITQCPVPPGSSITYTWKATQYGTTWYHSHYGLQVYNGVFGGIVINGPASANYDEDLGVLFLSDWTHESADNLFTEAQLTGPPTQDNGLINGTNIYVDGDTTVGSRFTLSFTAGTSYRLRLINGAMDTFFKFSIDNHTMEVIANDLVPIQPFNTTVLSIGIGQRYDVIIRADQADVADNFWMRAVPQTSCSSTNTMEDDIRGIVYYGTSPSTPDTTGYNPTDSCDDMSSTDLVPYVSKTVASTAAWTEDEPVTIGAAPTNANYLWWYVNGSTLDMSWSNPTLLQVYDNVTAFNSSANVVLVPEADEWVYVVISTALGVAHPIHLHGHDFFVLAQGTGTFDSSSVALNLDNPVRRDVAMLAAQGYLVIAFQTDNPGAWLMHCHIGWHTDEGLAIQFVERQSEARELIDFQTLSETCAAWETWQASSGLKQEDDGI
ncbi:multicopper oxidase-like protein [Thermothielavioides terrestris NRRL 8126]|uniref:laccase n=1 Tax=Thermothielavioides terrestris (strain ATCC 38088 / NRRL 8126) TaxID=578455 RepID=G2QTJ8_THETT|nr:multicopper oxidase-like protein [Thermothielavioides terrestris NRRL 8126]AEO64417.1 multicopper oxidase-like protein [Thermothielavioides terrestris NRRL 8126]